jgi:hypothetical protein
MPKKKGFPHGTLKIVPSLPLKTRKKKKENQGFLSRQFYAALKNVEDPDTWILSHRLQLKQEYQKIVIDFNCDVQEFIMSKFVYYHTKMVYSRGQVNEKLENQCQPYGL